MRRWRALWGWLVVLVIANLAAAPRPVMGQAPLTRDLFRKSLKKIDTKPQQQLLASAVGLPDVKGGVVALEYAVLMEKDGQQVPIADPGGHEFHVGDQIRVRIQPLVDVYIYIFHEGASGVRNCLLPQDQEKAPLAKADQVVVLPLDESVFEFAEPTGNEKLIVVAAENPNQDLAVLSNVVFKKDESELTEKEKQVKAKLSGISAQVLKSVKDKQERASKHRGLLSDPSMKAFSANKSKSRAVIEEPPTPSNPSTFAMAANSEAGGKPELFLSIPLKSVPTPPAAK